MLRSIKILVPLSSLLTVVALCPPARAQCPLVELLPPDTQIGDRFGETVVLDGEQLWVGAPAWSAPGSTDKIGKVYWLSLEGVVLGSFVPPGGTHAARFGKSLAVDGNRVLVGAPGKNEPLQNGGEAWLFEESGGIWTPTQLLSPAPIQHGYFGKSVALAGDLAFVGESSHGSMAPGSVRCFRFEGGVWVHDQTLSGPTGGTVGGYFGASLALQGDRLVVGAPRDGDDQVGAMHVFENDGTNWNLVQSIYGYESSPDANGFGGTLALDGDVLATAATDLLWSNDAFIYRRGASQFELEATFNEGDPFERFGWAVAVKGDRLLVGAPRWNSNATEAPKTYVYEYDGVGWPRVAELRAAADDGNSHFGCALDVDDARLLVGAAPLGSPTHLTGVTLFEADQLAWADTWTEVGPGLAGTLGLPGFWIDGPLCEGGFLLLRVWNLTPSASAWLVLGLGQLGMPFKGGVMVPTTDLIVGPSLADAGGSLWLETPLPLPVPAGFELVMQYWIPDPGAPNGYAATPGIAGYTAP